MARLDVTERLRRSKERLRRTRLDRYVLAGEHEIFAQRQHWAMFAEPVTSALAGLVVVLALDYFMPTSLGLLTNVLWWGWFALVARALWKWLLWRHNLLVATDQRLLLTHGLVTKKVAMMPLTKVTDMSYNRSPLGRLIGYGTFIMESAGQDQALRRVDWVAHPDHTYRAICAQIFGVEAHEPALDEHDHRFEDGPPPHTPGLYADYVPPEGRTDPSQPPDSPDEPDQADESDEANESTGIPIRYGKSQRHDRESWFQSPDLGDAALRDADTGPIPYRRPATDEGDGWTPTTNDRDS